MMSHKQFKTTIYGLIAFLVMFALSAMLISGLYTARKAFNMHSSQQTLPADNGSKHPADRSI